MFLLQILFYSSTLGNSHRDGQLMAKLGQRVSKACAPRWHALPFPTGSEVGQDAGRVQVDELLVSAQILLPLAQRSNAPFEHSPAHSRTGKLGPLRQLPFAIKPGVKANEDLLGLLVESAMGLDLDHDDLLFRYTRQIRKGGADPGVAHLDVQLGFGSLFAGADDVGKRIAGDLR